MYFDITYIILVLPAVIFSLWASAKVNGTYRKYKNLGTSSGMTGAQAARLILDRNGLRNVRIMKIDGQLTDHYDPRNRISASHRIFTTAARPSLSALPPTRLATPYSMPRATHPLKSGMPLFR